MRVALVLLVCGCLAACGAEEFSGVEEPPGPLRIAVTFYPNEYLVQRIAAESVEVFCDVPLEADVLDWIPTDEQLARIRSADLIVLQGVGLEPWVERADLPMSRVCVASRNLTARVLRMDAGTAHSHGSGVRHEAGEVDPHIWLDPVNTKEQAAVILARLQQLVPSRSELFETRFRELAGELDALSETLRAAASRGESLCASHPAYEYLVSGYGFRIHSFDFDPAVMPTAEELTRLRAVALENGARSILWESEPTIKIAARIQKECGLRSLVYSPCELLDPESRQRGEDYLTVQQSNAERLR